jgi:XRE family transcriptional regulator
VARIGVQLDFPETGYTPANLAALISHLGMNQSEFSRQTGIPLRTLQSYLASPYEKTHRDMPLAKWIIVLKMLDNE